MSKDKGRVKWGKLVVFGLCGYMIFCLVSGCFDIYKLKVQEKEMAAKIVAAQEENELWQEKVEEMSSPEAIERIARERLGLVMPGEITLKRVEADTAEE